MSPIRGTRSAVEELAVPGRDSGFCFWTACQTSRRRAVRAPTKLLCSQKPGSRRPEVSSQWPLGGILQTRTERKAERARAAAQAPAKWRRRSRAGAHRQAKEYVGPASRPASWARENENGPRSEPQSSEDDRQARDGGAGGEAGDVEFTGNPLSATLPSLLLGAAWVVIPVVSLRHGVNSGEGPAVFAAEDVGLGNSGLLQRVEELPRRIGGE